MLIGKELDLKLQDYEITINLRGVTFKLYGMKFDVCPTIKIDDRYYLPEGGVSRGWKLNDDSSKDLIKDHEYKFLIPMTKQLFSEYLPRIQIRTYIFDKLLLIFTVKDEMKDFWEFFIVWLEFLKEHIDITNSSIILNDVGDDLLGFIRTESRIIICNFLDEFTTLLLENQIVRDVDIFYNNCHIEILDIIIPITYDTDLYIWTRN